MLSVSLSVRSEKENMAKNTRSRWRKKRASFWDKISLSIRRIKTVSSGISTTIRRICLRGQRLSVSANWRLETNRTSRHYYTEGFKRWARLLPHYAEHIQQPTRKYPVEQWLRKIYWPGFRFLLIRKPSEETCLWRLKKTIRGNLFITS